MPGRKPSPHLAPEGIDQSVMPKTVDQLSREGFQQKRLGFGEGQPSRLQVEQLVVVQTAAVAPCPQTTSSAKISSSGLLFIAAMSTKARLC